MYMETTMNRAFQVIWNDCSRVCGKWGIPEYISYKKRKMILGLPHVSWLQGLGLAQLCHWIFSSPICDTSHTISKILDTSLANQNLNFHLNSSFIKVDSNSFDHFNALFRWENHWTLSVLLEVTNLLRQIMIFPEIILGP